MLQAVEALIAHLEPVEREAQAPTFDQERRRCGRVGGELHGSQSAGTDVLLRASLRHGTS